MLDRTKPEPLWAQLSDIIQEKMESEAWPPRSLIPSENELSKMYGVSRMTVRSVITNFVRKGQLYRVPGKGTFVSEKKIVSKPLFYMGLREQLERMGIETETKTVKIELVPASSPVDRLLGLPHGEPIYHLERLRLASGEPIRLHVSFIPEKFCPGLEHRFNESVQLCDILENEYKLISAKVVETLESYVCSYRESKLLDVKTSTPILLLQDTIYGENSVPFEFSRVLFRGDKIVLRLEYEK